MKKEEKNEKKPCNLLFRTFAHVTLHEDRSIKLTIESKMLAVLLASV